MKTSLSVITITHNNEDLLDHCLNSVKNIATEIVVIDDQSQDQTIAIAKQYKAKIWVHSSKELGRKTYGIKKATSQWILILDTDEIVSKALSKEIRQIINSPNAKDAYFIPYQNHLFGKPLHYGGENYQMIRFFRKGAVEIKSALVHEEIKIKKGSVGYLKAKIYHYSYRSIRQIFTKFTDYGIRDARQKHEKHEKSSLKKVFLYPPHLFWARYIKDKGCLDGLTRIILDFGFAYMEWLTYTALAYYNITKPN